MKCPTTSSSWRWPPTTTTTTHEKFPTGAPVVVVNGVPTLGTNVWVELLPYFEQDNLYKKWDPADNRNNVAGGTNATKAQVIKILLCPSDPLPETVCGIHGTGPPLRWSFGFYGMSSYGGNAGKRSVLHPSRMTRDGIFFVDSSVRLTDVTDGTQ